MKKQLAQIGRKIRRQIGKDYVFFPALTGPACMQTITANATANLMRNLWSYMIIFCGHFPDGALHFTEEEVEDETRAEWYLRQMLGSANFTGGPLLHIMSGNLGYQIEHHLFPDLPSNRYAEISDRVRPLCDKYGIPYTTGPLHKQYGQALRTITKLSLPNRFTKPARHDYPETPEVPRGRRSDEERPIRRTETGGWTSKACMIDMPAGGRAVTSRSPAWATSVSTGARSPSARSAASAGCAGRVSRVRWPSSAVSRRPTGTPSTSRPRTSSARDGSGAVVEGLERGPGLPVPAGGVGSGDHLGVRVHPAHAGDRGRTFGVLAELRDRRQAAATGVSRPLDWPACLLQQPK